MEMSRAHSWSNLVIPYNQHPGYTTPTSPLDSHDKNISTENNSCNSTKGSKKKNPYSIEELLKKPDKKTRPLSFDYSKFHQPYGVLVENGEFDREASCHSATSDSDQEKDIKIDVE